MGVIITCSHCKSTFEKDKKEVNRIKRTGRTRFFCSISCGRLSGKSSETKIKKITKQCLYCKSKFVSNDRGKESYSFCSRSCASAGSVTQKRKESAKEVGKKNSINLMSTEETLRRREGWKYKDLGIFLNKNGIRHKFEFKIQNYVVDLILLDFKVIVEFDGPYHLKKKQLAVDKKRDLHLRTLGYKVLRMRSLQADKIHVKSFKKFIEDKIWLN